MGFTILTLAHSDLRDHAHFVFVDSLEDVNEDPSASDLSDKLPTSPGGQFNFPPSIPNISNTLNSLKRKLKLGARAGGGGSQRESMIDDADSISCTSCKQVG